MSFNLSLATSDFVICVTDRRLTKPTGGIVTERSTKLTSFVCSDTRAFVTYTGIGRDLDGETPSDWLAGNPILATLSWMDAARAIGRMADSRLARIAARGHDTRHSFIISGYCYTIPVIALISNFETLNSDEQLATAKPSLEISAIRLSEQPSSRIPYALISTGALPRQPIKMRNLVLNKLKAGADARQIRSCMVKAVRDVAYGQGRTGSVGTSVLSGIVRPFGDFEIDGHIPGGSTLLESANFISPGMIVKDVHVDVSGNPQWRPSNSHKGSPITEVACQKCGTPVPQGYSRCGVCDAAVE